MMIAIEILFVVMAVWLIVNTVTSCITLWVLWKSVKPKVNLPGVHKNKTTKEALRSLDD